MCVHCHCYTVTHSVYGHCHTLYTLSLLHCYTQCTWSLSHIVYIVTVALLHTVYMVTVTHCIHCDCCTVTHSVHGHCHTLYTLSLFTLLHCVSDRYYFYNTALQASGSISEFGTFNWQVFLCLAGAWLLVYICLFRGVESSGKVSIYRSM